MYTNSLYEPLYGKNYSFTSFMNSNYKSNQYYQSKVYDDHRFQRRKLQKPAFLIKQQAIYPQSSTYSIGRVLDYAENLTRPMNSRFYSQAAEQQRIRVQGKNPFLNQSYDQSLLNLEQSSRMKKSSRSRVATNPNLGVTSYQVLQQNQPQETQFRKQKQRANEISAIKKQTSMEDYISESIVRNFNVKPQELQSRNYENQRRQQQQIRISNRSKRQTFNPGQYFKKKTQSTLVKLDKTPEQLIYKGKKFVKLIN